jgi:hypothetical protein
MGINQDALMMARARLCDTIDGIAADIAHVPAARLVQQVDDIRRTARDYGFDAVAELAHRLESAMARSDGAVTVLPYLEAMRDAAGCERADPAVAATFLAAVGQRLHG